MRELILIVDDEENVVHSIMRMLSMAGYETVGTVDADEAITILRKEKPAVLICDQRMPKIEGLELLQKARRVSPSTIRMLITGYSDIDVVIAAINKGQIYQYISKPWQEQDFLGKVHLAIGHWQDALNKEQLLRQSLRDKEHWKALFEQSNIQMKKTMDGSVNTLKKIIQAKDPELLQHSTRVSEYAVQVARQMELPRQRQRNLQLAGLFHDIGKIAIRDQILYKPDRLDDHEFDKMKQHPVIGAEILQELGFFDEVAAIVLQHHEKYDGSGYPHMRQGESIVLEARVLALADAYDALVSKRVYRAGLPHGQVMEILSRDAGSHFDPTIVEQFRRLHQQAEKTKDNK